MIFDVDRFLQGHPLCITEAGLEELRAHIAARIALLNTAPTAAVQEVIAAVAERNAQAATRRRAQGVGIIPIRGTISQRAQESASGSIVGGAATEEIALQLDEFLADEEIGKIILDIDSPGGSSFGVAELAARIRGARGQKPIIALANSQMASAAYWIGSQADYVYSTPGGFTGSIGTYTIHQDVSAAGEKLGVRTTLISAGKYKTRGNQFEPLSDDARESIQDRVNAVYDQFVADVAKGRGTTDAKVRGGYGEGDVLDAKRARAAGLIDGVATLDQLISRPFKSRAAAGDDVAAEGAAGVDAALGDQGENTGDESLAPGQHQLARMRLNRLRGIAAAAAQSNGASAATEE